MYEYDTNYCIILSSGRICKLYMSGLTFKEADEICENNNGIFFDENQFAWDMSIEETDINLGL